MIRFLLSNVLVLIVSISFSQTTDPAFQAIFSGPAQITAMAKQADDKIIIAGNFLGIGQTKTTSSLIRLNTNGTIDTTFDPGTGPNALVSVIVIQSDGKILIGGRFTSFNSVAVRGLVRLSATGALDNTFNVGSGANNNIIYNLALQSDGKIIVRGGFTSFNAITRNQLVRLNTNGSVDETFTCSITTASINRYPIVVQSDNKIILGSITEANGVAVNNLVRLNADGTTDAAFVTNIGTGPNSNVYDIGLQSDNKIVISGDFIRFNSVSTNATNLARLNSNGVFDNTFTQPTFNSGPVSKIKIIANNKILVYGGVSATRVSLYSSEGIIDTNFNPGTGPAGSVIGLEEIGGNFIIAGEFTHFNGTITLSLARTNATGALDMTYLPRPIGPSTISVIKELAGGSLLVGGNFILVNGIDRRGLVKLTNTGAVDGAFTIGSGFNGIVHDVELQGSNIIVGGEYSTFNATSKPGIARLTSAGALDATFTTTLTRVYGNDGVRDIHVQGDNKIILAGSFTQVNGNNRKHLARVNSDGTFDGTFNPTDDYQSDTEAIKKMDVRSDGRIILVQTLFGGGTVSAYASIASNTGARVINLSNKFTGGQTYLEDAIFLPDGKILLAGYFARYENVVVNSLARITDAGTLDPTFRFSEPQNASFKYNRLAIFNSNRILIGRGRTNFFFEPTPEGTFLDLIDINGSKVPNAMYVRGDVTALRASTATAFYVAGPISKSDASTLSAGFSRLFEAASVTAQPAPAALAASNLASTSLTLNWNEAVTGETGFEIQRSQTNALSYQTIGFTGAGITTFNDAGLLPSTVYYYKVRGVNSSTATPFSAQINITTLPAVPTAPSNLVSNAATITSIGLVWSDNSTNETGFEVYRSIGGNTNFVLAATLPANTTTSVNYTDTGLTQDTQYFYKVRAINGASASAFSNEANRTTLKDLPLAPTEVVLRQLAYNKIKIQWKDNATNETGYKIFNSSALIGTVDANTTFFIFENAQAPISIQIRATNNNGDSNPSGSVGFSLRDASFGEWSDALTPPALPGRSSGIAFTIGTKAYVGLGQNTSGTLNDLWEFDSQTGIWTAKANFPGTARIGAVAFVINGKGYVGTGNDFNGNGFKRDFYEYDPATNVWTAKAEFPEDFNASAGITSGIGFAINGFGYVGLGNTGLSNTKAFYRYDPSTNSWTRKADFGGLGRFGAVGFAISSTGYVAMGYAGLSDNFVDLWSYDPTADVWTKHNDYFGIGRGGAAAFVIRNNAIITAGEETGSIRTRRTNYVSGTFRSWSDALDLPGPVRTGALAFSIGEKGYVFGGRDGATYLNDFYSFIPGYVLRPVAPENLKATYASLTSLTITWEDKSDNENQFLLEVSVNGGAYSVVSTLNANTTSYLHENLTTGSNYRYRITAVNNAGNSPTLTMTVPTTLMAPPAAPSNLTAVASALAVTLNWTDNSTDEFGFEIYRSDDDGVTYTKIISVAQNATTYRNTGLLPGKQYFFKILAYNFSNGEFSNSVSATPLDNPPLAPNTFAVVRATQTEIDLLWVDGSNNETGFEIARLQGNATIYTPLDTLPANTVTFTDKMLTPDVFYRYRIRALNAYGSSSGVTTSTTTPLLLPETPTNMKAELLNNEVVLTWSDNAAWEESYELVRTAGSATEQPYQTLGKDVITFADKTFVSAVVSYKYRVRAVNKTGASGFSNEVAITLPITLVTSILEEADARISIYPSPAQDRLVMQNNSNNSWSVRYSSMQGIAVHEHILPAQSERVIEIESWPAGMYLLQFFSDEGVFTRKIIKE